jgi:hypothetical protein
VRLIFYSCQSDEIHGEVRNHISSRAWEDIRQVTYQLTSHLVVDLARAGERLVVQLGAE